MKKIILLAVLLMPFVVLADENYAINGVDEPQWKDFAPHAFVDVKEPKGIGKLNDTAVYWYKRRVDFEAGLEKCRAISETEEKVDCYQQLRAKQYQKNSDYNARLEAIDRAKMGPQEMYDRTNDMLPIGGYLNNFMRFQQNEIR